MQSDVLSGPLPAAGEGERLKAVFRRGWSHEKRVEGWVAGRLHAEFTDPVCREAWKHALRAAVRAPLRTALDIGTGPGTVAQLWAELGCKTTGLDFSPGMLSSGRALAEQRGLEIDWVEGDAEYPEFGRKRFDVVSSRFVLFTLPHPGYALRRWVALLRRGGSLVLIGHHRPAAASSPLSRETASRSPNPQRGWQVDEEYQQALGRLPFMHHTAAELAVVMEAAGLQDIRSQPVDDLLAARASLRERLGEAGAMDSTPYILVGRR